jgi:predicted Zn-dependent peptidase
MKSPGMISISVVAVGGLLACVGTCAAKPQVDSFALDNGIRVLSVHFPGSNNVSVFTFLPMGLACDGRGNAQWSHLVEHLIIRTTVPAGSGEANAETLPDHMRLDFYGTVADWQQGLSHHAGWLEGLPFTAQSLGAERQAANAECDFVAKRLLTHKFGMAAWAQGYRHGLSHAAIKADAEKASLREIQGYRDQRLGVPDRVLVCVAGGIDAQTLRPVISEHLGKIRSRTKGPELVRLHPGSREMTWDMDARHLMLTWAIPSCSDKDYPALMAAGQWLMMKLFSDQQLKKLTGMVIAGADLVVPEGRFFYVSASLKADASPDDVRKRVANHLESLRSAAGPELAMIARQLSYQLTNITDPKLLRAQAPPSMSEAMIEGNVALQWATNEYRYGAERAGLAGRLGRMKVAELQRAVAKYLSADKCSVCSISPTSKP